MKDYSLIELVGQVAAYAGIGLALLVIAYYVLDVLTPGKLGSLIMGGAVNAAILAGTTLFSLGLVLWFAIFFTGAGWNGIDDYLVFGITGVVGQAIGFLVVDAITPGRYGKICESLTFHPAVLVSAGTQLAVALIISASLT